jgi:aminoglycoside phosphotransferase (APT) family kinase protein
MDGVVETAPVRPDEEMDWARLAEYLGAHLGIPAADMQVLQFPGGSANLTYLVSFTDGVEYVVRRPPLGVVAPGAHDMVREHKVLSRLHQGFSKAPRCLLLCEDESVIGAKFIVTERRTGVVIRDQFPREMLHHKDLARRTSYALVDALGELHNVDPAAVDLSDLGKPTGFAERQVRGWYKRWELAKDRELPEMDELYRCLVAQVPQAQRVSIVHNDPKLDNCQFQIADPDHVSSVFDWDMATLGDPLIDLGTVLGYWPEPTDPEPRAVQAGGASDPFPTRAELTARYCAVTGLDAGAAWWYETFALWKTVVVLQQMYIRYKRGQTKDERFAAMPEHMPELIGQAQSLMRAAE